MQVVVVGNECTGIGCGGSLVTHHLTESGKLGACLVMSDWRGGRSEHLRCHLPVGMQPGGSHLSGVGARHR